MAVSTSEITTLYGALITEIKSTLTAEFDANRLTSDLYAKALVSLMSQTMQASITAVQQQPILTAQATKVANEASTEASKKLLVDAQELKTDAETATEGFRQTLLTAQSNLTNSQKTKTDSENTTETNRRALLDAQTALAVSQELKVDADTAFVKTQEAELSDSVVYNNKIKALDAYADMIGTMGAGSLDVSDAMWTTLFDMIAGLNGDASTPSDTNVGKLT